EEVGLHKGASMAEDKVEAREVTWRQLLPWTQLFRGFQVALDLNKLLLAAAGILVMASGWLLWSVIFSVGYPDVPPEWPGKYPAQAGTEEQKWAQFKHDRDHWNLMHGTARVGEPGQTFEVADLAQSPREYDLFGRSDKFKGVQS